MPWKAAGQINQARLAHLLSQSRIIGGSLIDNWNHRNTLGSQRAEPSDAVIAGSLMIVVGSRGSWNNRDRCRKAAGQFQRASIWQRHQAAKLSAAREQKISFHGLLLIMLKRR